MYLYTCLSVRFGGEGAAGFVFVFVFFSGQREIGFASHLAEHFTLVVWVLVGATILTYPVTQNR